MGLYLLAFFFGPLPLRQPSGRASRVRTYAAPQDDTDIMSLGDRAVIPRGTKLFDGEETWRVFKVEDEDWDNDDKLYEGAWYYPADGPSPTEENYKEPPCAWSSIDEVMQWISDAADRDEGECVSD